MLCGTLGPAAAQDAVIANPATAPDLKLSADQKHTIYLSISNQPQKETAPLEFRAAVGAVVPASVNLQPLPKTIVELMPQVKDYQYAMVANQVLLVEPKSKQVVDIIND
jgi:hypothetical protein